ncbi:MAG: Zn-ribbon domain-containing OB-fold protein [Archaeoglobales archaeon]|nr:Zn-ribbon domain-containing OB-fold protein [Archaeoglobales archaeon]
MIIESRELPLKHNISVKKTEKYWKGLEEGKIYKTVCKNCGKEYSPPQAECTFCRCETDWVEISGVGVVEAFTTIHTIPKGFEWSEPYTIVIARFGNVRVMGWGKNVKVGDKVRAYTAKDAAGVWKVYLEVV